MSPNKRHLLLFDIDGTLIVSGGAGERALCAAMKERFGVDEDLEGITLAGATDKAIAQKMLAKSNLEASPENITALIDAYLGQLREQLLLNAGRILPGIVALLNHLKAHEGCVLALLTGNVERGAQLKLGHYGVWDYFEFGAFADDHHDRNELGKFAQARALEKHAEEFPPERIFVIGDTPRDIECGKAIGAKTVAIATGNYSSAELKEHQPDFLFEDLGDTDAVVRALLPA